MADSNLIFAPVSEPQSQFLTSDAWLTIYGGKLCASI